jgi:RNA polymerase sigma factor (sigma-70 family)
VTSQPLARLVQTFRDNLAADGESDDALLARLRAGRDPAAAEAIVRRHGPRVLAACRKVLGPAAEAEDAFQATFLVLLRNPAAVRRSASLGAWLYGVAHRIALQARARRARRLDPPTDVPAPPELPWSEACAVLHEELDQLPDAVRLPLVLCYLDGLSRDEAAQQLGRSLNSVKKALEKGRELLRRRLTRRGVTLSAGLLAAVAGPAEGEPTPELVASVVRGAARPAAVALAATVRSGFRLRLLAAGLAAGVLAVGVAVGFSGEPMGDPRAKEPPAKAAAKGTISGDEQPKGERTTFAGRVFDPDGKSVAGAKVYITGYMHPYEGKRLDHVIRATTDADGRYRFELPRGEFAGGEWRRWHRPLLAASFDGFGLGIRPFPEDGNTAADIRLVADHPVRGRIVDLQGRPVTGATVRLRSLHLPDEDNLPAALAKLREGGWHRFRNGLGEPFRRRAGELNLPFPGVPETHTGPDGKFTVSGLGGNRLALLTIEGRDIAMVSIPVLSADGEGIRIPRMSQPSGDSPMTIYRDGLRFVAAPTQPFEGTITDKDTGKPISGLAVRAYADVPPGWEPTTHVRTMSDANGRFRLLGLPDGRHIVLVDPGPGFPYFQFTQFGGRAGSVETVHLDFALKRAAWVTGRVVDVRTGSPVADTELEYWPARGNESYRDYLGAEVQLIGRCRTDLNGGFRVPAAPGPGWLFVHSRSGPFVSAHERPVQGDIKDRTPRSSVEVEGGPGSDGAHQLRGLRATVRVTANLEKPADYTVTTDPGVTILLRLADPDGKAVDGTVAVGARGFRTDLSPQLPATTTVEGFPPERPRPIIFMHPTRPLGLFFEPKPEDTGPWDLTLKPTATVTARLTRRNGDAIADEVVLIRFQWQGVAFAPPNYEFRTDKNGRVRLTGVIGDLTYTLWCRGLIEKNDDVREHSFRAKPGEVKNLGDLKPHP